ncbi:shikimate 5-dehydrogenase [Hydrogenophaga taeniospiralis CCUG 15921]|uniref:Shikimate dehydrogenase (NADP(+)) n=2 Tax=Hydrogenophaga TaxID=47420 RepID=A0A9X4NQX9_9BURK|nr:shikimate 5-dehydrogenase [Hydrogenophaga taeniospiralis CCUG 15921]
MGLRDNRLPPTAPPSTMTDRYAVIGHPISHSKSPLIHGLFAQATGQDITYTAIEAPLDGFRATVEAFRASGGRGMNVTLPFKLQAFEIATDPMESARLAGAVNALKFDGERIHAQNFDGLGLVNDIQRNLGVSLAGKRVLICGAGGATRGAIVPIAAQRPALIAIANRSADKAHGLKTDFAGHAALQTGGYEDLAGESFDVVLNATSTGLSQAELPLPAGVFAPGALAYELVYGKGLTPFLRQAQAAGVTQIADGVGMLVEQAAEAFEWWRGVRPVTRPVIDQLTVPLV